MRGRLDPFFYWMKVGDTHWLKPMIQFIEPMKKLSLLVLALALSSLSSCQTMQGLGRDVQSAGSGIQNAGSGLENAAQR